MLGGLVMVGGRGHATTARLRDFAPFIYVARCCCWRPSSRRSARQSRARRGGSSSGRSSCSRRSWPSSALIVGVAALAAQFGGRDRPGRRLGASLLVAGVPMGLVLLQPDLGTDARLRRHHARHAAGRRRPAPPPRRARAASGVARRRRCVLQSGVLKQYQKDRLTVVRRPGARGGAEPRGGVQPRPGQDRHRRRRADRQGPVQGHPDPARQRARAAHRLHLHRGGRGARLRRRARRCSALLAIIVWRVWRTAQLARDDFGTLVCVGVLAMFVFQIFENVGHDHGHHADHRHPPAVHVLRRLVDHHAASSPSAWCSTSTCAASAERRRRDAWLATVSAGRRRSAASSTLPRHDLSGRSSSRCWPRSRSRPATSGARTVPRLPTHDAGKVAWLLVYPDTYEIGLPNQGLQILYEILNERPDAVAERTYAPWTDLEALLRAARPAAVLGRHPPRRPATSTCWPSTCRPSSSTRTSSTASTSPACRCGPPSAAPEHPLVGAGGHCTYNPEPLADFLDFVVLGDGEEVVGEITEVVRRVEGRRAHRGLARAGAARRWPRSRACTCRRCTTCAYDGDRLVGGHAPLPRRARRRSRSARSPTSPTGRTRSTSSCRSPRSCTTGSTSRCSAAAPGAAASARPG